MENIKKVLFGIIKGFLAMLIVMTVIAVVITSSFSIVSLITIFLIGVLGFLLLYKMYPSHNNLPIFLVVNKVPAIFFGVAFFSLFLIHINQTSNSSSKDTEKHSISSSIPKEDSDLKLKEETELKNKQKENEKRSEEIKVELNQLITGLPYQKDEMEDLTYIYNSYLENFVNRYQIYPFLATSTNIDDPDFLDKFDLNLLVRVSYEGSEWLFVNSIIIKTDNNKYEINKSLSERDNSGGSVWEWFTFNNRELDIVMLEDMMNSNSVTIRLNGKQYHDDRELTANEKEALKQIIPIYKLYNELKSLK